MPQVFIDRTAPPAPVITMTEVRMAVEKMAYITYIVYDAFLRPPDPEDVCLILSQMYELYADPRSFQEMFRKLYADSWSFQGMFSKFDDPKDPFTKFYAVGFRNYTGVLQSCKDDVGRLFIACGAGFCIYLYSEANGSNIEMR